MKKEAQLHHLIHTLTAAEKKYVRLNINKFRPEEESKNLLLFDTLNKQKKYQTELTNKAYEVAGYTSRFLAADRHQLYDMVLDGLSDFHSKSTVEVQISTGYQKAVLLFEKKLFEQALKQIERTVKLARQLESYGSLINLLNLKQRILKIQNKLDASLNAITEQQECWTAQARINEYIQLHYQSIKLRIELAKVRSAENLAKLDAFMQHPLLQGAIPLESFHEQFHYWETYCNYYFIQDNKQQELVANHTLVTLIDTYPIFKKNEPLNQLIFSTRILAIQRNLYPELFETHLAVYRALNKGFSKQKEQGESVIFIFSYNYELDYYMQHQEWDKGLLIIPKMLKGLKKYDASIRDSLKLTAYYRIAYVYFFKQQYFDALDALDNVLQGFPPNLRPDVHSFALLLKIIIHFELGNIRLMPYLIKTAQYHIAKRNLLFQTEKIALQYLRKLSKLTNQDHLDTIFNDFEMAIQNLIQENKYERRSLEIFNFLTWFTARKSLK